MPKVDAGLAVVLSGKLGSFGRPGGSGRAVDDAHPTLDVLGLSWNTIVRHVLAANPAGPLDIIGHSWSPSVGAAVDALFQVRLSSHQPEELERNRHICQELVAPLLGMRQVTFATVGHGRSSCERTASQMLSLRRAIQLKAQLEHRRGSRYARVLMARWDVAWASPMRLSRLPIASNAFVVPQGCVSTDVLDEPVHNTWRARVCGRGARAAVVSPLLIDDTERAEREVKLGLLSSPGQSSRAAVQHQLPDNLRPAAYAVWQGDLWIAAGSAEADALAQAGGAQLFANLTARHARTLSAPNAAAHLIYGHTIWGLHLMHELRAALNFAPLHLGIDFSLARYWWRDRCRALRPTCAGGKCGAHDVRRRSWHGELGEAPARRPCAIAAGASSMAGACSDGYFYCARGSRMCSEEHAAAGHGLDEFEARAVYFLCSERLCAERGVAASSAACAGWLVALGLQIGAAADRVTQNRSAIGALATERLRAQASALLGSSAEISHATWLSMCPDLDLLPKLLGAPIGYCAMTDDNEGDCERGSSGSFRIGGGAGKDVVRDHASCIERCRRCQRCNFVSISAKNHDCSWFHKCRAPLGLHYGGNSYLTFAVPKGPLRASDARHAVAIGVREG